MVFGAKTAASEVVAGVDLSGVEVIVTGAASGIGVETARAFALAKARVVLAVRDVQRGQTVADDIIKSTANSNVEVERLDLSSLKSVREFVARYIEKKRPLHILVNNAGIMACPLERTVDGFESQFGTNHIGHFALTLGLMPALIEGAKQRGKNSRVVSLSSAGHGAANINLDDPNFEHTKYDEFISYAQSKTANVLFAVELTRRYQSQGVLSNALNPGGILTGLQKNLSREWMIERGWMDTDGNINPTFKNVEQGASTSVWAAVAEELENKGGLYLDHCAISVQRESREELYKNGFGYLSYVLDQNNAKRLWDISEQLIASK